MASSCVGAVLQANRIISRHFAARVGKVPNLNIPAVATIPTVPLSFSIDSSIGKARRGRLLTPHAEIETPVFMPVGTVASVKGVPQDILEELRRAHHPRQYVPPVPAAGNCDRTPDGRFARVHGVAASDPDGFGWLSSIQPERIAQGHRGWRDISFAPGWLFAFFQPGERNGGADRAGC